MKPALGKPAVATPARFQLIKEIVAKAHGVTVADIDGKGRPARVALARQHAMALARGFLVQIDANAIPARQVPVALEKVAAAFNRDDHGTVAHALKVVAGRRDHDPGFAARDLVLREAVTQLLHAKAA